MSVLIVKDVPRESIGHHLGKAADDKQPAFDDELLQDADQSDLQSWGSRESLAPKTLEILQKQDILTVKQLQEMELNDLKECFFDSGLLKAAQYLAVKKAVIKLHSSRGHPPPPGVVVPAPSVLSTPPHPTFSFVSAAPADPEHTQPSILRTEEIMVQVMPHCQNLQIPQSYPSQHDLSSCSGEQQTKETTQVFDAMCLHATPQPYNRMGPNEERLISEGKSFRFLLLGKTGGGKSTTGNTIFADNLFPTNGIFSSVTKNCDRKVSYKRGMKIEIIDSPGLYDTHKTHEETCLTIVQAVAGMHPGPHAILYVVPLSRYTAEEFGAYQRLKALFDDSICKYMIVVFTGGDTLETKNKTIESIMKEEMPKHLEQVLSECNNRYIVFNNIAQNPHPQVQRLFSMVREMVAVQGGQPYACPKYSQIGQGMEEEVARRVQEVENQDLKRQKYVQELEDKMKQVEKAKNQMAEQFQKNEQERQRLVTEEASQRQLLVEKLQVESRKQEELLQQHQQEVERLRVESEKQERRLKEKEHEMTEKEKQRAAEDAERRAQQERELQVMMKQQQAMMEENAKQRQLMEEERQKALQEMEQQRLRESEELKKRKEELDTLWLKVQQQVAEANLVKKELYDKEMEQLKNRMVSEDNYTAKFFFEAISKLLSYVVNWKGKSDDD